MEGMMVNATTLRCYTQEWQRTQPDYVVYLPQRPDGPDGYADHFLVEETPRGVLLAIWTTGDVEAAPNERVVCSRSIDGGLTWSDPHVIADNEGQPGEVAWAGFPLVSAAGRIYCWYNKNVGVRDGGDYFTGVLRCAYSDADGLAWTQGHVDIPYRRTRFDNPDPRVPCKCVVWQKPIRDARGRWLVGLSRWSSAAVFPPPAKGYHLDTSSEVMRFENIDAGPHPADVRITWLPEGDQPIRVACPIEPERSRGYSLCEEPGMVLLPDGRLFMVLRTVTGRIWYTVSDDEEATTWRTPEPLRYQDGGEEVLHPKAPCPLFALRDGRFLLLFHHHDGFGYGASGPWDMNARRPLFLSVGAYRATAHQPIWFSRPKQVCDTHGVGVGPESLIWLAMYSSVTEQGGRRVLWYPDRKHFLLGRAITDEWLADMEVPRP
jgi:hypothetical protein